MTTNQVVFFVIFILLIILSLIIIYRGFTNKLIKIKSSSTTSTEGYVKPMNDEVNRVKDEINEIPIVTPDGTIDNVPYSGIPEPRTYIVGKGESSFSDSFQKIKNLYKYKYER